MKRIALAALLALPTVAPASADGGRLIFPFVQALDSNGDPISGALWCFEAAGTTSGLAVYSDKALTTSLGSTVTTNSQGRLSSDVYGSAEYKVTLKTGADCATGATVSGPWDYVQPQGDFADIIDITAAQTWTANHTWQSDDSGASADPTLTLYRNSASPAANDTLGRIIFSGQDLSGQQTYATIQAQIIDTTGGSEDGAISILTVAGGAVSVAAQVQAGLVVGSPTGGDQGAGTVNATNYYRNGTVVAGSECFTTSAQSMTANTAISLAHSLSGAPWSVDIYLENTITELNYSVGQQLFIPPLSYETGGSATDYGVSVERDATNLIIYVNDTIELPNATSGEMTDITLANWRLYARACL